MPRLVHRTPSYRLHKGSGQAVVTLSGRTFYLGEFESAASRAEFDRLVSEWIAGRRSAPPCSNADLTITELIEAYVTRHAQPWYRKPTGRRLDDGTLETEPTSELSCIADALKPLRRLYGHTQASAFGPLALQAVRDEMIRMRWCRGSINRHIGRVRRVFRWAEGQQILPKGTTESLATIDGLKRGRSAAKESMPVRPVAAGHARAIYEYVSAEVAAMVELQLLTGMRPGEVCTIRGCDIDTTGELWSYTPASHKTAHHGHDRRIFFGPRAQSIVCKFFQPDLGAFLFSPASAERRRREKLHKLRTTAPSSGNAPGQSRRSLPQRKPGNSYTVPSYGRAIKYGCRLAFPAPAATELENHVKAIAERDGVAITVARKRAAVEHSLLHDTIRAHDRANAFHPHQLRHTAATEIRKRFGLEAAQVLLGHATLSATQVYAEKNEVAGRSVAAAIG